jgi:hypothetical protein
MRGGSPPFTSSLGFESVFQQSLGDAMADGAWHHLIAGLGMDMADSVHQALSGVAALAHSKRLGAQEARWLQAPLQRLYHAGIAAQQLSHLSRLSRGGQASGTEVLSLDSLMAESVAHHSQRLPGHHIAAELTAVDVLAEPELLTSAIDALLAWGTGLGRDVHVRLVREAGTARGEIWLRVTELARQAHEDRCINSVNWYVLWQLARLKGVKVRRKVEPERIRAVVRFDRVMSQHSGMAVLEASNDPQSGDGAFDPERTRVWCAIPRGNTAAGVFGVLNPQIRQLRMLGDLRAMTDSPDAPDCVVGVAEFLNTETFRHWRRSAQEARGRQMAVIEICAAPNVFDVGGFGSRSMGRVSENIISQKLLTAIVFELSQLADAIG